MKNMTSGNPARLIVRFAIPLLIGSIFQQVYSLVDTMIVGKYLGGKALAGVGNTGHFTLLLLSLIIGLTNGAGIIAAQCFGADDKERLRQTVTSVLWISSVITAVIILIGVLINRPLLRLLAVPDDVMEYSATYLFIIYLFIGGTVAYNGSSAILRSLGDSKTPLYGLIIASALNILLDYFFILVLRLGVAGAAIATVISQHVSAVYCILHLYRSRKTYGLEVLDKRPDPAMIKMIFKTGVPTALQSSLITIGNLSVQRLVNSFGASVMAAYAAGSRIDGIAIQVIVSLGTALSVFTGQNVGGGRYDRIRSGLRSTLCLSCTAAFIIALCAFLFGADIMRLFLNQEESGDVVTIGANYLSIMGAAYMICAIMQSYQNIIRGSGDVNTCMAAGFTELTGRVLFAYILTPLLGYTGIWIATPLSWGCGCIVPVIRYYSGKWKAKAIITNY